MIAYHLQYIKANKDDMRTLYVRQVISQRKKHRLWFVNVDLGLLDLPKDVFGLPPKTDDGTMQGTAIAVAKAVALYFKKFLREILLLGPASK